MTEETTPQGDPMDAGMQSLREAGCEPIRIWSTRGPKGVGGLIAGVFLQATNEVVILHQLPSGRYGLFKKDAG